MTDRRSPDVQRIVWWLLGIFSAVTISLTGAWGAATTVRLDKVQTQADATSVSVAIQQAQYQAILDRLNAIDAKLTRVLNR